MALPPKIDLIKDGKEVPLQELLDQMISVTNALLKMRGAGSIRVHKADTGFVIDGSYISGSNNNLPTSGSSTSGSVTIYAISDVWL